MATKEINANLILNGKLRIADVGANNTLPSSGEKGQLFLRPSGYNIKEFTGLLTVTANQAASMTLHSHIGPDTGIAFRCPKESNYWGLTCGYEGTQRTRDANTLSLWKNNTTSTFEVFGIRNSSTHGVLYVPHAQELSFNAILRSDTTKNIRFGVNSNGRGGIFDGTIERWLVSTNWDNTLRTSCTQANVDSAYGYIVTTNSIYHIAQAGGTSWASITCDSGAYGMNYAGTCDRRIKKNIQESSESALGLINKIKHREFDWKDQNETFNENGYIAQEIQEIFPNGVIKVDQTEYHKMVDNSILNIEEKINNSGDNSDSIEQLKAEKEYWEDKKNNPYYQNDFILQINENAFYPYIGKAILELDKMITEIEEKVYGGNK